MLAFVSYETAYSPCGGISAVLARLPGRVAAVSSTPTVVITPFHHQLPKMATLGLSWAGQCGVNFDGRLIVVHIHRLDGDAPHYFLRPEDPAFFAGNPHPYQVDAQTLQRDSLFFGAAAWRALSTIAPGARWTLLLQDWESATVALAASGQTSRPRMFLTLHNSYDCEAPQHRLQQAGFAPHTCPGNTILQRALGVCEWPVFTVSDQFAHDLVEDPFQTQVLAPHLAPLLGSRLVGVDNGPFTTLAVPKPHIEQATGGDPVPLLKWKHEKLRGFLNALDTFVPDPGRPLWGDLTTFRRDDSPLFVMAGRDDCRQKGYDVAARSVELTLNDGIDARFVFFPMPGDEGLAGLTFLRQLAEGFPEQVLVLPFRFAEGFLNALQGATCGIMPSLYEPFGMTNEFYLNGTIGIGRATGGILQQIVPVRSARSWNGAVASRVARLHSAESAATGFLFREPDGLATEVDDWRGLNATEYLLPGSQFDRVHDRLRYPLFRAMVDELKGAIQDVLDVAARPAEYAALLTAGIAHIEATLSWERSAQGYLRYARVSSET